MSVSQGLLRVASAVCLGIVAAACGSLQQAAADTTPAIEDRAAPATAPVAPAPAVRRIALLVPLSGPQRAIGEAIRDGFIGAQLAAAAGPSAPEVLLFDELAPGPVEALQSAIEAGVDTVVGPLLKESVEAVMPAAAGITLLALNSLEPGTPTPTSAYQFPLAPEDEAEQAARRAVAEGRFRAVALVPDTDWGRRMLGAFTPALEGLGGRVVAFRYYNPSGTDYTGMLERLLLIDESRARHKALVQQLGTPLEFEPRRRSDADFVFLAGTPTAGRLIRPQLRFVYASDLPVYASSAIHQPGSSGDADMDGIAFPDAPAVLGTSGSSVDFRRTISEQWPAGGMSRLRFFAMGHDAWSLALALGSTSAPALDGLSGLLTTDADRRLHRELVWGAFRDGGIVPLPDMVTPTATGDAGTP